MAGLAAGAIALPGELRLTLAGVAVMQCQFCCGRSLAQGVDALQVTSHQCCLQLSELRSGEGASGENGSHAGLDGGFIGAACFGITDEGDELSGERVHGQAGE
jgi:hypothetical protein